MVRSEVALVVGVMVGIVVSGGFALALAHVVVVVVVLVFGFGGMGRARCHKPIRECEVIAFFDDWACSRSWVGSRSWAESRSGGRAWSKSQSRSRSRSCPRSGPWLSYSRSSLWLGSYSRGELGWSCSCSRSRETIGRV